MTQNELVEFVKEKAVNVELEWVTPENGDAYFLVKPEHIHDLLKWLKETWEVDFDYLVNLSAWDSKENLDVVYHLYSYKHAHSLVLKARVARQGAQIPTVSDLFGTANWQEREVYDHFGIQFKNHPNLKRILLPDDWDGHPLLKDYQEKDDYNGIGTTRPSMLN